MSEYETSDGVNIHYEHQPGTDALVFIHGWLHNRTVWKHETAHFHKQGHETLAADLRGHGRSEAPDDIDAYSLERHAQDIREALEELGIQHPTLIGHSLGGLIALSYYKQYRDAKRLVLIDSTYENPAKHVPLIKNLPWTPLTDKLIEYIKDRPRVQRTLGAETDFSKHTGSIPSWLVGAKQTAPHVILSCMRELLRCDEKALLAHIDAPTLLIVGEDDNKTPAAITQYMHEHIANSELVTIPAGTHDTPITHPERITKSIEDFLQKNP